METRYGPVKLKVPKGFPVLLQRFAREVLREQPTDIAQFGVDYFRSLLDERTATGKDPLIGDPFDEPGFHSASQKVLRPISSQTRQNEIKEETAATKIQAGYRGYQVRKQSRQERERKHQKQQERAAIRIQAQYRGYRTRRSLAKPPQEETPVAEPQKEVEEEAPQYGDEEKNAAVRIQANFRGYQARKSLKQDHDKPEEAEMPEKVSPRDDTQDVSKDDELEKVVEENEQPQPDETTVVDEPTPTPAELEEKEETEIEQKSDDAEEVDDQQSSKPAKSEEELAALKIQASYRGHMTRKQLKHKEEGPKNAEEPVATEGVSDAGSTSEMQKTEEMAEASESKPDVDEPDPSYSDTSGVPNEVKENPDATSGDASEIQSKVEEDPVPTSRDAGEDPNKEDPELTSGDAPNKEEEGSMYGDAGDVANKDGEDSDPVYADKTGDAPKNVEEDPAPSSGDAGEVQKKNEDAAALKIQSRYRGYRTRKQLQEQKQDTPAEPTSPPVEGDTEQAASETQD